MNFTRVWAAQRRALAPDPFRSVDEVATVLLLRGPLANFCIPQTSSS